MSYQKGINKTTQIGFVTKGPELTKISDKLNVCELTMVNSYVKTGGEGVESQEFSEFHSVKFYGPLANHVNRVAKKKQKIYIEGRITTETWEAEEGEKRYKTVLVADNFQIVAFPKDGSGSESDSGDQDQAQNFDNFDDDIPF